MSGKEVMSLRFISNNEAKLAEYRDLLKMPDLEMLKLPLSDLQHHNLENLAASKIEQATRFGIQTPFFVEHTGLVIAAWGELPGGLTGQFVEQFGAAGLCKLMESYGDKDRAAIARTVIGYFDGRNSRYFIGQVFGEIAQRPRGQADFGWDTLFIPQGYSQTYAEMGAEEKNDISMRRKAASEFAEYLKLHPLTASSGEARSPSKHIFLSYCRDNAEEVAQLHADLIAAGEAVWWDQDIQYGQDWRQEIRTAMKRSYAVLLCLSAETSARTRSGIYPEALDAIGAYREYAPGSIFLIPVRFSECEIPSLEIDSTRTLDRLQFVDLFPATRRAANLKKLIQAIQAAPEHP